MTEPNHARRFTTIWAIATIVAMPIVILVIGPIKRITIGSAMIVATTQIVVKRRAWLGSVISL